LTLEIRLGDEAAVLATPAQRESDAQAQRQARAEAAVEEDAWCKLCRRGSMHACKACALWMR